MSYISIDVDVDEVIDNMTSGEKAELVAKLIEAGYGPGEPHAGKVANLIYRIQVLGLDTDLTALEALERVRG